MAPLSAAKHQFMAEFRTQTPTTSELRALWQGPASQPLHSLARPGAHGQEFQGAPEPCCSASSYYMAPKPFATKMLPAKKGLRHAASCQTGGKPRLLSHAARRLLASSGAGVLAHRRQALSGACTASIQHRSI